ncbi:MAG: hypothetical protein K6U78_08875, partial [Anaerolineae bacterium]|nr:hypothetical protein [Anaerolineae bacterium]
MQKHTRVALAGWMAGALFLSTCSSAAQETPATPIGTVPVTVFATSPQATTAPTAAQAPTTAPTAQDTPAPTSTPTETPYLLPKISLAGEGINVVDYGNANLEALRPLGFGWIQVFNPPEHPIPDYRVLYRVPLGDAINGDPATINAWADQLESLARERRGVIHAYSIGNEVNLAREWGGHPPDPQLYARLLAIAYARIKTADPDAVVIWAGFAPTGGDGNVTHSDGTQKPKLGTSSLTCAVDSISRQIVSDRWTLRPTSTTASLPATIRQSTEVPSGAQSVTVLVKVIVVSNWQRMVPCAST